MYFLGRVAGTFVGETGQHPDVLAAVLPAMISGIGGLVIFRMDRKRRHQLLLVGLAVVVFSAAFLHHTHAAVEKRILEQASEAEVYLGKRAEYLKKCSEVQFRINTGRAALELSPLQFREICPHS